MTTRTRNDTAPTSARRTTLWWAAGVACLAVVVLAITSDGSALSPIQAVVLGAVEGITEFLPISSTGHLLVAERLMGLGTGASKTAMDTYTVAIQLGAILAVLGIYRTHLASMTRGLVGRDHDGRRLLGLVALAFMPAAAVGLALDNIIKAHLFGIWPVVAAWTVGGLFLLIWRPATGRTALDQLTARHAAIIGTAQVLALWPGTSRSLVTITAALALGLTMSAAVEFSFLLGLATLAAATGLDLVTHGRELTEQFGVTTPTLGAVVAAITAAAAVTWFVTYLRTRPMTVFGWYRLAAAAVTISLLATQHL